MKMKSRFKSNPKEPRNEHGSLAGETKQISVATEILPRKTLQTCKMYANGMVKLHILSQQHAGVQTEEKQLYIFILKKKKQYIFLLSHSHVPFDY